MAKKLTKTYINKKIEMLDGLIKNAISLAQAAIYEGYRKFWIDKLSPSQNPDVIAEKKALKEAKAEELEEAKALKDAEVEAAKAEEVKINAEKEAKLTDTLQKIEDLKKLLPKPEEVSEDAPGPE